MSDRFVFPPIRRDFSPRPHPELLEGLDDGHADPELRCMRFSECQQLRWHHPKMGELVLCLEHAREVALGERHAPPLRRGRDYYAGARRSLVIEDIPGLPITDPIPMDPETQAEADRMSKALKDLVVRHTNK